MEFEARLVQHFTPAELVEFLGLDMDLVMDRFSVEIEEKFEDLCEEIGVDLYDDAD